MKHFKSIERPLVLLFLFCLIPLGITAQNLVKGLVNDESGEPIIGATIRVVGSQEGCITDRTLSDVVVIGYGTAKRSDISGSVTSVNTSEMMKRAPVNLAQGLQGSAPGVLVTAQDGAPNAMAQVRIRGVGTINGNSEPLYVVDGVQVGTNANFLNPQDIDAIEILKDASATAIYGSRGANGVVLITTKHGSKGNVHVDVSAGWGLQTTGKTWVCPFSANNMTASVTT